MSSYLFQLSLPPLNDELESLVPANREYVNQMFSDGSLLSYSVSALRDFIWCVISAEDEAEAIGFIADFPLFSYFTEVRCFPLLFHNTMSSALPGISMN